MRVFLYEHLCSLPEAPSALRAEGWAMLAAALEDLSACEGVTPVALVEPGLVPSVRAISPRIQIHSGDDRRPDRPFRAAAADCDLALLIAPEFDDLLASRADWTLQAGCRLLGPSPDSIRLCADKFRLADFLRSRRIPVPETALFDPATIPVEGYPRIVKPRSGAGATATFLVRTPEEYLDAQHHARALGFAGELIAQPYHCGRPASVALLFRGIGDPVSLLPTEQEIEIGQDGRMRYMGGAIRAPAEWLYAGILAECVGRAIPDLRGYVGIDLVYDGFDTVAIEVNPRLTTSYVGLRRLYRGNLMKTLLELDRGQEVSTFEPNWHDGSVRFDPSGASWVAPRPEAS